MNTLYPWQRAPWERLSQGLSRARLPHALLMTGIKGLGKQALAQALAGAALCTAPGEAGLACGQCPGCLQYQAGTHPDFMQITPEEAGKAIKVDQIRALVDFMVLSRASAAYRVALISPAEAMNLNAANSLLKTLEEPAPFSLIILVASRAGALPVTVRSRCQTLTLTPPSNDEALAWLGEQGVEKDAEALLKLAHGAPLTALQLAESSALEKRRAWIGDLKRLARGELDAPSMAQNWADTDPDTLLDWLLVSIHGIIRSRSLAPSGDAAGSDQAARTGGPDLRALFALEDKMIHYRRMLGGSLNAQLFLEDVLLTWVHTFARKPTTT